MAEVWDFLEKCLQFFDFVKNPEVFIVLQKRLSEFLQRLNECNSCPTNIFFFNAEFACFFKSLSKWWTNLVECTLWWQKPFGLMSFHLSDDCHIPYVKAINLKSLQNRAMFMNIFEYKKQTTAVLLSHKMSSLLLK